MWAISAAASRTWTAAGPGARPLQFEVGVAAAVFVNLPFSIWMMRFTTGSRVAVVK